VDFKNENEKTLLVMIDVTLKGRSIVVALNSVHPDYNKARIIVRALLTSHEFSSDKFIVSYDDLGFLRNKLDMAGLVDGRTINDEALSWIKQIQSKHVRNEDIKNGVHNEHVKKLLEGKIKTTPYEDQIPAISYIINNRRVGIFDTMGYGKTPESLMATVALGAAVRKTLVICPLSVIIGFKREVFKHTYLESVVIPSGRKEALSFLKNNVDGDWDCMFVHPENLIISSKSKVKYMSEVTKILKSMTWDQTIIDEFHMYKNWTAKRTRCVAAIINESRDRNGELPRVVLMTGTPVSENPNSSYVALNILNNDSMPHISRFDHHFCDKRVVPYKARSKDGTIKEVNVKKLVGYKNLDELRSMIEKISIRRTKSDVKGFPEQTTVIRDVILNGKQLSLYKALCNKIVNELPKSSAINISSFLESKTSALRLRQLINHPSLIGESGDSAKYKELDYVLEELLADREQKVVIWTEWRAAVELLHERYNKEYGVSKIYGGVGNDELELIRDRFENDDDLRVVVSIPAKGGTGLDFLARARTAIYVDRPRSFILYNQSLDRICRRVPPGGNLSKLDEIRAKPATLMFLDVINSLDGMIREELWETRSFKISKVKKL